MKLNENVKNSPKNKIVRKNSKHEDVKSIKFKSQNSDMEPKRNKFKYPNRQSHYIEVVQGETFLWNRECDLGGFQLLDLIITELKSHMTC